MNQINLIGKITKELELKYTPNNKPVCEFTLAVNRVGQEQADFITCVVWNNQAVNLKKYQGKGSLIAVNGALRVDTYEVEGQRRYKTYVLVNNVEFLSIKKEKQPTEQSKEEDPFEAMARQVELDGYSDMEVPF